jgi:hypothetical protein
MGIHVRIIGGYQYVVISKPINDVDYQLLIDINRYETLPLEVFAGFAAKGNVREFLV